MAFATPRRSAGTPTSRRSGRVGRESGEPSSALARRQDSIHTGARAWHNRGRAATPKRAARSAGDGSHTRSDVKAALAPQSPQSRSGHRQHTVSAHQRTRAADGHSDVALRLSAGERRERERESLLSHLQQAMRANRTVFGHTIEDPQDVFAAFDRDGSGTLSPDEMHQALKRLGFGLTDTHVDRLLAFLDTNGDGAIDYGELLSFLSEDNPSETSLPPRRMNTEEAVFDAPTAALGEATKIRRARGSSRRAATPKRMATPKRAARSAGDGSHTRSDVKAAPAPQSSQSRSGHRQHTVSAHQRTRAADGHSDVALRLSAGERRERERESLLLHLQQAMRANRTVFGHTIEDPQDVFAAFDRDGSGTLSPDEMHQALKRLGFGLTDTHVDRLLAFLDTNGDGAIDYGELLSFLSETTVSPTVNLPAAQSKWRVELAQRAGEEADREERWMAASKLQARWRGFSTRKAIQDGNWDALPFDWLAIELAGGGEAPHQDLQLPENTREILPAYYGTPPDLITIGVNGGWQAAEAIQRTYRGHRGRRDAQSLRNAAAMDRAATHIQSTQRGRQQRRRHQRQRQSATCIQQHYRREAARQKLQRETHASKTIQRVYRGHSGRQRYDTALFDAKRKETAAAHIQASYRGHRDRVRLPLLAYAPAWQQREEKRAAVLLQSYARSSRVQRQLSAPECTELQEFLQTANLTRFFSTMFDSGIGSISDMDALTPDEMFQLGMQRKDIKKLRHYRLLKGPNNAHLQRVHTNKLSEEDEQLRRNAQAAAVGVGKAAAQAARAKLLQQEAAQELQAAEEERDRLMLEGDARITKEEWTSAIESFTCFIAHPLVGEVDAWSDQVKLACAYHKRGHCLQMLGNTDAAEDDYTAGIALSDESGYALVYHRGRLRVGLGDIEGAREDLELAQSIQSTDGPLGTSAVYPDELSVPNRHDVATVTVTCPEGVFAGETIVVDLGDSEISEVVPDDVGPGDEWDLELRLDGSSTLDNWVPPKLSLVDNVGSQDWSYEIQHNAQAARINVIGRAVQRRGSKTARGPADCLLNGSDLTIARRHAKITAFRQSQGQHTHVQRFELSCEITCYEPNFVHINGELVRGSTCKPLKDEDVITIGATKLLFNAGYWRTDHATATSIQELLNLCDTMEDEELAATKIQARVRGRQTRFWIKQDKALVEEHAATIIQSRVRGRLERIKFQQRKAARLPSSVRENSHLLKGTAREQGLEQERQANEAAQQGRWNEAVHLAASGAELLFEAMQDPAEQDRHDDLMQHLDRVLQLAETAQATVLAAQKKVGMQPEPEPEPEPEPAPKLALEMNSVLGRTATVSAEPDVKENSSPRGRLDRDRTTMTDSLAKALERDNHVEKPVTATSPEKKRRFPSKPRAELSAESADSKTPLNAVAAHDRAVKHYNDLVTKVEEYTESGYYETEAEAKVSQMHSEHSELTEHLDDEIAHAEQSLAAAEAQLARCRETDPDAEQLVQQERMHLEELNETRRVLVEEEEEIHALEVEAEIAEAKEAHAVELAAAAAAVEEAKLAIAGKRGEPEESTPLAEGAYDVDDEGYATIIVPAGVRSQMQIELKGGAKAEVTVPSGLSTGDKFEAYVGAIAHEPEPTSKISVSQTGARRRPRTPGKTKPNKKIFACGASPRRGVDEISPTPAIDPDSDVDHEPDHDAQIAQLLAQRHAKEHSPRAGVVLERAERSPQGTVTLAKRPVVRKLAADSLILSPAQAPSPRHTFNFSEAVSAGLSGLEARSPRGYHGVAVSMQEEARPAQASFNKTPTLHTTLSTQSPQWLPPTSSAASGTTTAWGVTPIPTYQSQKRPAVGPKAVATTTPTSNSIGEALGTAWSTRLAAPHQSVGPEADLRETDNTFTSWAVESRGVLSTVSNSSTRRSPTDRGGPRLRFAPKSGQFERARDDGPSPSSRGRRVDRKDRPNSSMTDGERERERKRNDAERRAREQHIQRFMK